ncbi:hypothetical protein, conserved [Plasmodium gonderi]|uniref:Uncharacterized protein n=1 Tax=Plasmodium gonderi TaxID=77519 RepID=A0A1Y1JIY2_PLAGO|nr:hypothetical protein, conserved [Plasmodium gonderi]GAW82190.1 hypothetical protein, conserved [Plasmodium gonderi]
MRKKNYEDTDSDSTVEETLVMLNLPQLNNDERKLKNLNIYRKKKGEKIYRENEMSINKKENYEKKLISSKGERKVNKLGNQNNLKIDLTNHEGHTGDTLIIDDDTERIQSFSPGDTVDMENAYPSVREIMQGGDNKNNGDKNNMNKNGTHVNQSMRDEVDNIPFEIDNISLKNLFAECPECIINNKYKFKGIHTSSIGTNFFFKEPDSLKNKSSLTNYELSYDPFDTNIKNENQMSRDDFSMYEGYSTKIISFEIDH